MTDAGSSHGIWIFEGFARAALVVGVFAVVGPPVGGLTAWLAMGVWTLQSPSPFVAGSYAEGLPLAVGAGIVVAAAWWLSGKTSWIVPVIGAIVANLVFHGTTMFMESTGPVDAAGVLRLIEAFLPASIVAALVCWFLVRRLLER
jgi:hypothetical protein